MTPEVVIIGIVAVVIIGIVLYLHTSAGKALEAKAKAERDALLSKVDSLAQTLHLVHAATLAPVSVVTAPQATAPAPAQPCAPGRRMWTRLST